jgi:uncharacterized membrane protein
VRIWERNLWFYAAIVISLLTVLVIYAVPSEFPLVVIRWILGSAFVLFIPGYVTVEVLFPRQGEIDLIERFALGVGMSLALVPLIALLLNFAHLGIGLTSVTLLLVIFTLGSSLIGLRRRFVLSTGLS